MTEPTLSSRLLAREYPKGAEAIMTQQWENMLFLHWEYDVHEIQKTLPKGLYVDLYKGKAFLGVTPFFMKKVKLKKIPFFPGLSNFLQINVRTYVYDEAGVPGIWFYSLDANNRMVVETAKNLFNMPYFYSEMESSINPNGEIKYRCQRGNAGQIAEFCYRSADEKVQIEDQSLEFFLIERYILYVNGEEGKLSKGRIYNKPYEIHKAVLSKWNDSLLVQDGFIPLKRDPEHVLFSSGVDVEIFPLTEH